MKCMPANVQKTLDYYTNTYLPYTMRTSSIQARSDGILRIKITLKPLARGGGWSIDSFFASLAKTIKGSSKDFSFRYDLDVPHC